MWLGSAHPRSQCVGGMLLVRWCHKHILNCINTVDTVDTQFKTCLFSSLWCDPGMEHLHWARPEPEEPVACRGGVPPTCDSNCRTAVSSGARLSLAVPRCPNRRGESPMSKWLAAAFHSCTAAQHLAAATGDGGACVPRHHGIPPEGETEAVVPNGDRPVVPSRRRDCHSAPPTPPHTLPVAGVSIGMWRGRQQNDSLTDG